MPVDTSLVKGFLRPVFYEEHRPVSALNHEDFLKVRDGYACAQCLAEYVTYLPSCPICGAQRDLAKDLQAPDPLHVSHLREREETQGLDLGSPRSVDDVLKAVTESPDVDNVPIRKLLPRRRK